MNGKPTGWEPFPCATKINEAGIKLEIGMATSILDINFGNGVLQTPPLLIQETTETILRNLISFELCCPNYQAVVTSYAKLTDNLIHTDKDIEILSKKDIIDNWLHLKGVDRFLNKLCNDAGVTQFYYHDICHQVNRHRKHRWSRIRLFYLENFLTPWDRVLLILAFLKTLYSILGAVNH